MIHTLKTLKNKFFIIFILLISVFLISLSIKWHFFPSERLIESVTEFKECMQKAGKIYVNETTIFFKEFKKCLKKHISIKEKEMDKFVGGNESAGMFMPLIGKEEECKWLTIGIDNSTKVESNFKVKYEKCLIFGADPYPPKKFSSIGKVFSFGIDLDNTFNTAVVPVNGTDAPKEVQVYSLPNLLINFIHSKIIYYLTMDIEGYEYKILESLVGTERYSNAGLTFCQISVNLHNPKMPSSHPAIKNLNMVEFILKFLQYSSPYIPIFNVQYSKYEHQKITFINIHSPQCEAAFKFTSYF